MVGGSELNLLGGFQPSPQLFCFFAFLCLVVVSIQHTTSCFLAGDLKKDSPDLSKTTFRRGSDLRTATRTIGVLFGSFGRKTGWGSLVYLLVFHVLPGISI